MVDSRAARVFRQHVETERLLGVEAVPVDAALLAAVEARRAVAVAQTVAEPATPSRPAPGGWQPPVRNRRPPAVGGGESASRAAVSVRAPQLAPLAAVMKRDLPATVDGDVVASLRVLDEQAVRGCTQCGLHVGRAQTVFGEGNPAAALMIVGEGPGADEDQSGQPFAGAAGALLDKQLAAMKLSRDAVYLTNVVKCYPPGGRAPTTQEAAACGGVLRRQIEVVSPRVILTVGGPAAKLVLGVTQSITQVRGTWHTYEGPAGSIPVMPTYHPNYLLRAYTPENRRRVWGDLQAVLARLDVRGDR